MQANNFVQATPVYGVLFAVSWMPGVPDENRSAAGRYVGTA